MAHYEILIRLDPSTGAYLGSHYHATPGAVATPIPLEGLPAEIAGINAAAINALELQRIKIEEHSFSTDHLIMTHEADIKEAAEAAALTLQASEQALSETRQLLATHQAISDALVAEARAAVAAEDYVLLSDVLRRAGLTASARERERIQAQLDKLNAALEAVRPSFGTELPV